MSHTCGAKKLKVDLPNFEEKKGISYLSLGSGMVTRTARAGHEYNRFGFNSQSIGRPNSMQKRVRAWDHDSYI